MDTQHIKIYRYEDAIHRAPWDQFIFEVNTPFFFFKRDFLDYHKDRFEDASVLVYAHNQIICIVPASSRDGTVSIHGGLTYGSFLTKDLRHSEFKTVFQELIKFWRTIGVQKIVYKSAPFFFNNSQGQNDIYELWRAGSLIIKKDLTTYVDLKKFLYSKGRKSSVRKGEKQNLKIDLDANDRVEEFHQLLTQTLFERHNAAPTHSLAELKYLMDKFPENIHVHIASKDSSVLAGSLTFSFGNVNHTQYLCVSDAGKTQCALDVLIDRILQTSIGKYQYLSFGISTEDSGKYLNEGLLLQKESFGGINCCVDTFSLNLKN